MIDSTKIMKLRIQKGVSQNTVSRETMLPVSVINKIESGRVDNPMLKSIKMLADYYHVKIDELIIKDAL